MPYLTSEAKAKLSATIRSLRDHLLTDLHNAVEGTYRLSLTLAKAGLAEEQYIKRQRLDQWLDEQVRAEATGQKLKDRQRQEIWERHLRSAEKLAAATLLNRLIVIKQMEAMGLSKPAVVTGGWQSRGYREFRDFAPDVCRDETEGFGTLLQLFYDELALEMPGLFGRVNLMSLFPIPASTLRTLVEALDDPALRDAWLDDTTLGWVYQYWNDPEREELDAKVANGGKIENYEIAPKTQLFTERYMVEWLLQNSLNQQWLAICEKNGWEAEAKSSGLLDALEKRRQEWKQKRECGEVGLEEVMPLYSEEEHIWKYWSFPFPSKELARAVPPSICQIKILDPAAGSGHFLIIAFTLLTAFYEEEARHRDETWTRKEIAESIIENNLHGVELDSRAVQLAAASLFLKAKSYCKDAKPKIINLVSSNLGLASLPKDDPAIVELKKIVEEETGIPGELTEMILEALKDASYLGSLLKIDKAVEDAIEEHEKHTHPRQLTINDLDISSLPKTIPPKEAKEVIFEQLDVFLKRKTSNNDSGLLLRGEQLAAGIRFIRLIRRGEYHLVIANPPYLGTDKLVNKKYIEKQYPRSKADLYAVFLERGLDRKEEAGLAKVLVTTKLDFARYGGLSAMITMRGWLFIKEFEQLRKLVIPQKTVSRIADLHFGAFPAMKDVSATMSVLVNAPGQDEATRFLRPVKSDMIVRDLSQIKRNISGLTAPHEVFVHCLSSFKVIQGQPFIYWWSDEFLKLYTETPKLGEIVVTKVGLQTGDNIRFSRKVWEVNPYLYERDFLPGFLYNASQCEWQPFVKGAAGRVWIEPLSELINWKLLGAAFVHHPSARFGRGAECYFHKGVAFSPIGNEFSARLIRYPSIFAESGASVFPPQPVDYVCLLNSSLAKYTLQSLNPTVNFKTGDVKRLPLFPIESADEIFAQLDRAFTEHEAARETSVEFRQPGASCWNYAQQWAQQAVDREPGASLPDWNPVYDQPPATQWVSYAIGVALGRFTSPPSPLSTCGEGGQEGGQKEIPGYIYRLCRELRANQTPAEEGLWAILRDRQLNGLKFRRQHPLGRYIADFYCAEKQLVIELDGSIHRQPDQQAYDQIRDQALQARGLSILRISNHEIEQDLETVLQKILETLSPSSSPSPRMERGQGGEVLPHGILYLSAYSGDRPNSKDSLTHPACQPIHAAWNHHGSQIAKKSLRDWLRLSFFKDVHLGMYEQRPIYFPLSSKNRNFVAYISIHRWTDTTLQTLLADYLVPELRDLEGETADLLESQSRGDRKTQAQAEERRATVQALFSELQAFIHLVQQCAEQGTPAASPKDTPREANARFQMDLDDGVMINSAALWCLLEPQWNKPKTWWSELCNAKGKKDYDWSHLAARYFPDRVDAKCQKDPSLAVAHGVFWNYHPAKAYEWELRLQDEIAPDFTIDEANSDQFRADFEANHPQLVLELRAKEDKRRDRKYKKTDQLDLEAIEPDIEDLEDTELEDME